MLDFFGTIGPASNGESTLASMIQKGMTGVRINSSHSRLVNSKSYLDAIRKAEAQTNTKQKVLVDLQGAELRIGNLVDSISLKANEFVKLVCAYASKANQLPVPKALFDALRLNPTQILLDDGLIKLNPVNCFSDFLEYQVESDCVIRSNKSIACDIDLNLPVLSEADIKDIEFAKSAGIYGIMIPFVQGENDLIYVSQVLNDICATHLKIYAKIENQSGVNNIKSIIPHCDCVVIARGDLGANIPLIKIPAVQKQIAQMCNQSRHKFMVVTQLLHSMIYQPTPTRAELCDIYNAVCDGANSLMLTGETAMGKYPIQSMEYLVKTALQSI